VETEPLELPPVDGVLEFRRRVLAVGFGLVVLTIFGVLAAIYLQFFHPIVWAASLAVLFYPLHRKILRLVRGHSTVAAVFSTTVSILVVFVPAGLVVFNLFAELREFWPTLQRSLSPETFSRLSNWLDESPFRAAARIALGARGESVGSLELVLQDSALGLQEWFLDKLRGATRSLPAALVQGGITILAFFFFLRHGPGWIEKVETFLPLDRAYSTRLIQIAGRTISAVFRGVLLTAAAQAVLAGVGFAVAGAPFPVLLACVTFVAALVPFVGPVAIWLPTAIGLYLDGHHGAAIGLALWGTFVVSLIDNILRPYLIGRDMKLPLLWLFLSMLGGLKLMGLLGVVVGPAALSLAIACWRIYREGRETLPSAAVNSSAQTAAHPAAHSGTAADLP